MNITPKTSREDEELRRQEEEFRKKASDYTLCFSDSCSLHEECLRWHVAQHADPDAPTCQIVNPRNPAHGDEHCCMFRRKQRVMMKRGFTGMFREMPTYKERAIRNRLISVWGRWKYFELRRGDQLLTPQHQQDIANACQSCGWTGPIVYDAEQESWYW